MTTQVAAKDAEIADLKIAALTAANGGDVAALAATKDAEIAALTASNHEQEIAIVACNTKLEARRLSRLAEAAEGLAADTLGTASTDASAADSSSSSSSTLGLAIGICVGIGVLATIINVMLRRSGSADDQYEKTNAFVNPMYSPKEAEGPAPVNSVGAASSAAAPSTLDSHVYGGNSALHEGAPYEELTEPSNTYDSAAAAAAAEDTYEDVVGDGAAETYADIPAGGAEEIYEEMGNAESGNYVNVQNGDADFNC